jgi:ribosome-associated protein
MLDPGPAPAPRAPAVDPLELVRKIAEAAWDKKARKMVALDVRELAGYTDYFVICSGNNDRQVVAIAKNVEEVLRRDLKTKPVAVEGKREGRWVIADFGDVILHVFQEPVREFYALDKLWVDAPKVELEEPEWVRLGE